jgi:hypothetical protein
VQCLVHVDHLDCSPYYDDIVIRNNYVFGVVGAVVRRRPFHAFKCLVGYAYMIT